MSKGRVSQEKKMRDYYRIFEQIYEDPIMSFYTISVNTQLSRNTVSKYLKEMYEKDILIGPYLRMKPAVNYKEYVYLLRFTDPYTAFRELEQFHCLYTAVTFGDWNILVITNKLLDFSQLKGFETVVDQEMRFCFYTPKVEVITWYKCFERVYEQLDRFTPGLIESKDYRLTFLHWGDTEWKLFSAFSHIRKKVTPVLKKIGVTYETYAKWMKTLEDHCTIHTEFYPEGFKTYVCYCFLFYTDYRESVRALFSLFPATSRVIELEKNLLVFVHVTSSAVRRGLMCLIYDMATKRMIKGFRQAVVLLDSQYLL